MADDLHAVSVEVDQYPSDDREHYFTIRAGQVPSAAYTWALAGPFTRDHVFDGARFRCSGQALAESLLTLGYKLHGSSSVVTISEALDLNLTLADYYSSIEQIIPTGAGATSNSTGLSPVIPANAVLVAQFSADPTGIIDGFLAVALREKKG